MAIIYTTSMDNLQDILRGRVPAEPPEVAAIKAYVRTTFDKEVGVLVREREIIISAPSAPLIASLRLRTRDIKQQCQLDERRLVFRIG